MKQEYPEHEKVKVLNGANQTIGEFLEYLQQNDLVICEWGRSEDTKGYYPDGRTIAKRLAAYFNIDQKKLDKEKDQILEECRKLNQ